MNVDILHWLNSFAGQNPLLDAAIIFFAEYAIYLLFLGAATWAILSIRSKRYAVVVTFFGALAASFLVLQLMGLFSDLPRPFMDHSLTVLIPGAGGEAFPSDHTAASAAIAFAFLFFSSRTRLSALLVVLAVLIGLARITSGVHYPLDVAGGLAAGLIGTCVAWVVLFFYRKLKANKLNSLDS